MKTQAEPEPEKPFTEGNEANEERGSSGGEASVYAGGNVVVTGVSSSGSSSDLVTIKYSGAGVPLWTNTYNGPVSGHDAAMAIKVDPDGNVVVTGCSGGTTGIDYLTMKYSSAGVPLWMNRLGGGSDWSALALDSLGNAYVTSSSSMGLSSSDYFTFAYSSSGVLLWTKRYIGPGNDRICPVR